MARTVGEEMKKLKIPALKIWTKKALITKTNNGMTQRPAMDLQRYLTKEWLYLRAAIPFLSSSTMAIVVKMNQTVKIMPGMINSKEPPMIIRPTKMDV